MIVKERKEVDPIAELPISIPPVEGIVFDNEGFIENENELGKFLEKLRKEKFEYVPDSLCP